jgi:hypothetical protein
VKSSHGDVKTIDVEKIAKEIFPRPVFKWLGKCFFKEERKNPSIKTTL